MFEFSISIDNKFSEVDHQKGDIFNVDSEVNDRGFSFNSKRSISISSQERHFLFLIDGVLNGLGNDDIFYRISFCAN